jgi:putative peptide zinc metalloprotease protein
MKTDLYYVLENRSGCYNLMENGQNFLRRWLPFLPAVKTSQAFDGEERLVRPYAIFYLVGVLLTIMILVFYNTPLIIHAGVLVLPGFTEPITSIHFWDATFFFLQFVIVFGLLGYSWVKKFRVGQE